MRLSPRRRPPGCKAMLPPPAGLYGPCCAALGTALGTVLAMLCPRCALHMRGGHMRVAPRRAGPGAVRRCAPGGKALRAGRQAL